MVSITVLSTLGDHPLLSTNFAGSYNVEICTRGSRVGSQLFPSAPCLRFHRRDLDRRVARRVGAISRRRVNRTRLSASANACPARSSYLGNRKRAWDRALHASRFEFIPAARR